MMSDLLKQCLGKLEEAIDPQHIARTGDLQRRAFAFEPVDHVPTTINYALDSDEWPQYNHTEIFHSQEKMLLSELASVYSSAKLEDDRMPSIRANYGTGIIASMFGCPTVTFDTALPISTNLTREQIGGILDNGVPDLQSGLVGRAFETMDYYRRTLAGYPRLSQLVRIGLLDIQGPFDNASIIWGSDVFLGVFDEPDVLNGLMNIITETIAQITRKHQQFTGLPAGDDGSEHAHTGSMCIRNDSSINLSRDQYVELCKPFDSRLAGEFTASMHFCGKAHQWMHELADIPGLMAINPYQGEFYDVVEVYNLYSAKKIGVFQWTTPLDERAKERIKTGFSRTTWASNFDEARSLLDKSHATGHVD